MKIYEVTLKDGDDIIEVVHVHAKSIAEALTKAIRYMKEEWAGSPRVASIEETSIKCID